MRLSVLASGPVGLSRDQGEQQISQALARGDHREAAHGLVRLYGDEMYRFCVHTLANPADGEELAQEVLSDACRSLARFRGQSTLRTWLYRVARHKLTDFYQRQGRAPRKTLPFEDVELADPDPDAEEELAMIERRQRLSRALSRLGRDDRQVLSLRVDQELPYAEIARILGVRTGAAKMRVARAVQRLQEEVGRDTH